MVESINQDVEQRLAALEMETVQLRALVEEILKPTVSRDRLETENRFKESHSDQRQRLGQ